MPVHEPDYLIPLSAIDYHILTALASRPLYGYALLEECRTDSEGVMDIPGSSLYPALARLQRYSYIQPLRQDPPQGSRHPRQIFSLTTTGQFVLGQETDRLRRITNLARQRLQNLATLNP